MRITNQTLTSRSLRALSQNLERMAEAQERLATGLRLSRASVDPSAASEVMRTDSARRAVEQHRRTLDALRGRLTAEENVLDQLTSVLMRAEELAVSQASATASTESRRAAKAEVDELLKFALSLGNARHGDEYIFGGHHADAPPLDAAVDLTQPPARELYLAADPQNPGAKREPTGRLAVTIAPGLTINGPHNAAEVFLDTGVLEALHELSHALGADDAEAIRGSLGALQRAFDGVQVALGDVGARSNQLDLTESSLRSLDVSLKAYRSGLAEAEFEEAATDLAARQAAYQAALLATSRVLNLSITDYLR